MPGESDAVAGRSFALEGRLRHVRRVALEADLPRRTSGAARRKSCFKRDALACAYGERKNNSADRISISAPIRRCHRNAGIAGSKSPGLAFLSAHRHLAEVQRGRRYRKLTSSDAPVRTASASATDRESRNQDSQAKK